MGVLFGLAKIGLDIVAGMGIEKTIAIAVNVAADVGKVTKVEKIAMTIGGAALGGYLGEKAGEYIDDKTTKIAKFMTGNLKEESKDDIS